MRWLEKFSRKSKSLSRHRSARPKTRRPALEQLEPRTLLAAILYSDVLVPEGSAWRYLDNGSDQDTAWVESDFPDDGWASGTAQLGYGDGDEVTVVDYGGNAANKHITTYFRHEFTVDDASTYTDLTLRLLRDDGAVVYVNGQEMIRDNMPAAPALIDYQTLAPGFTAVPEENQFFTHTLDPGSLVDGTNVLAVEVHQAGVSSSDISLDAELKAYYESELEGGPLISEFVTANYLSLEDEVGDSPDWIEIYNPTAGTINLEGWCLTDNPNNLDKWRFPAVVIAPNDYLVVFASGRDQTDPAGQLHTNFQLSSAGEYLALVQPDRVTVAHEYAPAYPRQFEDISYGVVQRTAQFVPDSAAVAYQVPDGPLDADWAMPDFDDSAWDGNARSSAIMITEAGTGSPDFFEIQNVSSSTVDTSDWIVVANNAIEDLINAVHAPVWQFPGPMGPGELLYRPDITGDNIFWRNYDFGWVMVLDGQGAVMDFVVWGYTADDVAGMSIDAGPFLGVTVADQWNGEPVSTVGATSTSVSRTGNYDHNNATDWSFELAVSGDAQNDGLTMPFALGPTTGIGFSGGGLDEAIRTDIRADMLGVNASLLTRIDFDVDDPEDLETLLLRMKYNDGFVAYLNGQEIARRNAPGGLAWDSTATATRTVGQSAVAESINVSDAVEHLVVGTNVLAIHGLNNNAADAEFLILPELVGIYTHEQTIEGFFTVPTPGEPNDADSLLLGPVVSDVTENPPPPADGDDLIITAAVESLNVGLASVQMAYRVMFDSETTVTMLDDGFGADATAGDGIYTAVIPHAISAPGEMVRWRIIATDVLGAETGGPRFLDQAGTERSPEYFGTVVVDPAISTALPVFHRFLASPGSAETWGGTRASVFYLDEFYDNIYVRIRGDTAQWWPKKAYKFDFNKGHHFRFDPAQARVEEINVNTTYTDKSYVRTFLAYDTFRDAGVVGSFAFPLRMEQNGSFFSVAQFVEQVDKQLLDHHDLDGEGALYKAKANFLRGAATSGIEKKTRHYEGFSDLQALINGLALSGPSLDTFMFDNVDLPAQINYMAANVVIQNIDRTVKNYYVYRDTNGDGEWRMLPWDVDLTFGPDALNTDVVDATDDSQPDSVSHPLMGGLQVPFHGLWNSMLEAVFQRPETVEMFYRRVRTLTDQFLGTTYYEDRIDELVAMLGPDVLLDRSRWGGNAHFGGASYTLQQATDRIKNEYVARRRPHLFTTHNVDNGGLIPNEQPDFAALPEGSRNIAFGNLEFAPPSGNQDEEYLEIVNSNSFAVDISGWQLTDGVRFTFTGGTVIPAGNTLYISPDVATFRNRASGPSGGQKLFVQGGYDGHLSSFGETIELRDANGEIVTSLSYPGNPSEAQQYLRISEIMYNPPGPFPDEIAAALDNNDLFEYVELLNTGSNALPLEDIQFTDGVAFNFADIMLFPGERALVVGNQTAFEFRYGTGLDIAGEFTSGRLNNGGEQLKLDDPLYNTIQQFDYDDADDWPGQADGGGASLVIIDPQGDYDDPANWQASGRYLGTPGTANVPGYDGVVINEVLTRTEYPLVDAIELYNTTAADIDISGWWLSDSGDDVQKFEIPAGTVIPADGYVTFYEGHYIGSTLMFDPATEFGGLGEKDFALDGPRGEAVWLIREESAGTSLQFADYVEFDAAPSGESLGRWPDANGELTPMLTRSLGFENPAPRIGPDLLISEVMYNPAGGGEYIEIYNTASYAVTLTGWRLRKGFDFDFAPGTSLDPHEALLVVSFDVNDAVKLADFRSFYGLGAGVQIFGNPNDTFSDTGERIQLQRPDTPPPDDPLYVPHVLEDEVDYLNTWHLSTDGQGQSLHRIGSNRWGRNQVSWQAAAPTPGTVSLATELGLPHVFYNNSAYDNQTKGFDDAEALALDKKALRPGEQANLANYTNYVLGINGLLVDVFELADPAGVTLSDLTFKVGNDNNPSGWLSAPVPTIDVIADGGLGGSDRIALTWADHAIENTWLEVTVRATGATGLPTDEVFYFGNAIGETGNSSDDARVDATDVLLTRSNPQPFFDPAKITNRYDFNRDRRVDAIDTLIARNHQTWSATELELLDLPASGAVVESATKNAGQARPLNDAPLNGRAWISDVEPSGGKDRPTKPNRRAVDHLLDTP